MKSSFLVKSLFSLSFLLAADVALANQKCPNIHTMSTTMICVENNTNREVTFSQFPNNFGDWSVLAHQNVLTGQAQSVTEEVSLSDEKGQIFEGSLGFCETKFIGNPAKPSFKLVRGCNKNI